MISDSIENAKPPANVEQKVRERKAFTATGDEADDIHSGEYACEKCDYKLAHLTTASCCNCGYIPEDDRDG